MELTLKGLIGKSGITYWIDPPSRLTCSEHLSWLFSIWRSTGSTLSPFKSDRPVEKTHFIIGDFILLVIIRQDMQIFIFAVIIIRC